MSVINNDLTSSRRMFLGVGAAALVATSIGCNSKPSEEAAKTQNTTIEPGNKTAIGPRITGVGGINGLEVEVDDKRLQFAAEAREEGMTPQEKANQYARNLKTYEGAKQVAARRSLNSNLIVPPRYGQVHYDPFANFVR